MELTAGYENAWSRGDGTYILSNKPKFDPAAVFQDQAWQRLKRPIDAGRADGRRKRKRERRSRICYGGGIMTAAAPAVEWSAPEARRRRLVARFVEWGIDSLVITSLVNVRYLTGFTGSNALLLLDRDRALLLTDSRYTTQVRQEADCATKIVRGVLLKAALPLMEKRGWRAVGLEAGHLTVDGYSLLEGALRNRSALRPLSGVVEWMRLVKSREEVERIRAAVRLTSESFERAMRKVKPGIRERELAAEIDYQMLRGGAERPAFETIVAFGARAALPHARPTANSLESNELLLIDMGAQRDGYTSDMTRMAYWGKPSPATRRLYRAVLEAQLAAVDAVRPGVTAHTVDRAARSTLRRHGLDRQFVHSTGHGLGLEIHEPPRLGRKETTLLEAGMVVTIEPGVYREGVAGVRIEDTVLVTRSGCEVLTPTSKELLVL